MVLTNSQEEYLKVIYLLNNAMGEVRVTDIAKKMNKTKASVTAAVNVLAQMELIEYKHYEPIKITEVGEREAIKVLEASNIVKLFMTDILNIKPEIADEESSKIKTVLSDDSLNRLAVYTFKELGISLNGYNINNMGCIKCPKKMNIKK